MKLLFVGQAPSSLTEGGAPFTGRSGKRIAALLGLSHRAFLRTHSVMNLVKGWPGKRGKGDAFPKEFGFGTSRVFEVFKAEGAIVFCGNAVAYACGVNMQSRGLDFLRPFEWYGQTAIVLPHPSGINRWWNTVQHAREAKRVMREFAKRQST